MMLTTVRDCPYNVMIKAVMTEVNGLLSGVSHRESLCKDPFSLYLSHLLSLCLLLSLSMYVSLSLFLKHSQADTKITSLSQMPTLSSPRSPSQSPHMTVEADLGITSTAPCHLSMVI